MKIGILITGILYCICVGFLATLRMLRLVHGLTTAEMFYGPALTIASAWVIFAIVYMLLGIKEQKKP